jgi:hypothetical protein
MPLAGLRRKPPVNSPAIVLVTVVFVVCSGMGEPLGAVVGSLVGATVGAADGDAEGTGVGTVDEIVIAEAVTDVLQVPLATVTCAYRFTAGAGPLISVDEFL